MKIDWNTPPEIVEAVRTTFGGTIDTDPCSNTTSTVKATYEYVEPHGLISTWRGNVFCNPPFDDIYTWAKKCAKHDNASILLIPANMEQPHWHDIILPTAQAVHFFEGRVKYFDPATGLRMKSPRFASAACYWGDKPEEFAEAFEKLGGNTVYPIPQELP